MIDAARLAYKPGWSIKVAGPGGRYLCVMAVTDDSVRPGQTRHTQHLFCLDGSDTHPPLPDDATDREAVRWVFDRLCQVERHETAEFLTVDGVAPFFPHHQGGDPYEHVERWETTCL